MPTGAIAGAAGAASGAGVSGAQHSKLGRRLLSGGSGGDNNGRSPKRKKTVRAIIAAVIIIGLIGGGYASVIQGLMGALDEEENGGYYETRLYVRTTDADNPDVIPLSRVPTSESVGSSDDTRNEETPETTSVSALISFVPGMISAHAADKDSKDPDTGSDPDNNSPAGEGNDPTAGALSGITVNLIGADKDDSNDSAKDQERKQQQKDKDKEKDKDKKSEDGSDSDSSSSGDLNIGPTDENGVAYTVLTGAANGAFTYACPAAFNPDASGRPQTFQQKWEGSGATIYDSYSSLQYSDTHTAYHLDRDRNGGACDAGFAKNNIRLQGTRNSPSDTWHIVGIPNAGGGDESKVPYYSLVYVYNNDHPEASYGLAVCADNGGGLYNNNAIIDQFMPANKYYGRYGLNVSPGQGFNEGYKDKGSGSTVGKTSSYGHYFEAFGIPGEEAATMSNVTVYVLDGYTNKHQGQGKQIADMMAKNQNWPGVTGNPVAMNSFDASKTIGSVESAGSGAAGQYEITYSGEQESSQKGATLLAPYSAGTKDSPFTTIIESKTGTKVRLEFWIEKIYIGPGGQSASYGAGNFSNWADTNSTPQFYCYAPKGQNPYRANTHPGNIDNSNRNALPNCTAYAWGLIARDAKALPSTSWHDAKNWASYAKDAGYSVDKNPRIGDVLCFGTGIGPSGHVAVVIGVDEANNKVTVAESGYIRAQYKNKNLCLQNHYRINDSRIVGYIHQK